MRRIPIFLLFAAICTSALTARADPTTYTPPVPSGVQGKLYRMSNRWEVGASCTIRSWLPNGSRSPKSVP